MCVHVFSRLSEDSLWHNAALLLALCEGMNEQVTSAWATVSLATSAELHRIFLRRGLDRADAADEGMKKRGRRGESRRGKRLNKGVKARRQGERKRKLLKQAENQVRASDMCYG